MIIQAALDALVQRPTGAPANQPPGLLDVITSLVDARVWEGEWDTLTSGKRVSLRTPAALVSLIDLTVVGLGQTLGVSPHLGPQETRVPTTLLRPMVAAEIAVTFVASGQAANDRAMSLVDLAEQAIPMLVQHALTQLQATNLTSDSLRERGLSAFVVAGVREFELVPVADGDSTPSPGQVNIRVEGSQSQIYPEPEC